MNFTLGALALGTALTLFQLAPALAENEASDGDNWVQDFDIAAAQAKKEGKDLLVDFTGSDWCGWCIKLDKEVFAHEAFLEPALKQYVLVSLDFPRSREAKAKVPNPQRNEELKKEHGVSGFPTILLMTADGVVYGQTGYQAGGPQKYLEHMNELRSARSVIPFLEKWDAASEADRGALGEQAIGLMAGLSYGNVMGAKLKPAVLHALNADAGNARGIRIKAAKALLASGNGDDAAIEVAREFDAKNERGLMEWALRSEVESVKEESSIADTCKKIDAFRALGKVHDNEAVFMIWVYGAFWNKNFQNDLDKAREYARLAAAIGTDNPQIEKLLNGILE